MTAVRVPLFLLVLLGALDADASVATLRRAPAGRPMTAAEVAQGYRFGRVLVVERPAAVAQDRRRADRELAEERIGVLARQPFRRLQRHAVLHFDPDRPVKEVIRQLEATGLYESVEPDRPLHPLAVPNDPAFGNGTLWGLHNTGQSGGTNDADIDAPEGWDIRREAPNVIVAIIDSGIRVNHQDLRNNLWTNAGEVAGDGRDNDNNGYVDDVHGINAITDTGSPADDNGHGTHVAGTIGAIGNNGIGSTGVAWRVQLMALKFLPAEGSGSTSDMIECIDYAIAHGAHIINASFGSEDSSNAEESAIRRARDAGIIFVTAAGNDAFDNDTARSYPSNYPLGNIVSVAASTRQDTLASFSNRGSGAVDLAAPGESIYSAGKDSNDAYVFNQGTSMAAPHVAGALALLRAEYPEENYRQLINRLLRGVDQRAGFTGRVQTAGRLNLAQALQTTSNRPFNDDFAARARIAGPNIRARNTSTGATREEGEPVHAGITTGASLWWEWTAETTGRVVIDTVDSEYDTALAIYRGTTLASLTPVASNDNASSGTTSRLAFEVTSGTTYQIAIAGKADAAGLTMLRIGSVPTNDDFANATTLTGTSVQVDASNRNASKQPGEPTHGASGTRSVWYKWSAPADGRYQVAAFSADLDTLAAVYTGSSLANLNQINASDDFVADNTDALVTFEATAGTTYHIAVDDFNGSEGGGTFTLTLTDSLWQAPATDEINGSPAIGPDGTIYFGSIDNYLYAIATNGARKWRYDAGDEIRDSAPAVAEDGTIYIGSIDGYLHAVNPNGTRKWRYQAGATPLGTTPALAANGTIYFRDDDTLHAVNPNGSRKWIRSLAGGTYSSPVVGGDGTVYIGATEGRLLALNPATGAVQWTFTGDGDIFSSPAIAADGTLYVATLNGLLYAINPANGAQQWARTLGNGESISSSPVLGADGTIYLASYNDHLYAYSRTGAMRWAYAMEDEVRASSPAVASDGTLYIGNYDGFVYVVNTNGTLKTKLPTARTIRSAMKLADGRLYFTSADAKLYAFAAPNAAASPWPQFQRSPDNAGRAAAADPGEEPPPDPEEPPPDPTDTDARAVNLSTLASVGAGDATLIGGFVLHGGPRRLLIRAVGPTLTEHGVSNPLANPRLELFDASETSIATNDDWSGDSLATIASQVGAFALPEGSSDAALIADLGAGRYTAHVTSATGAAGPAIVEFYEIGDSGAGRFANLSTRASINSTRSATAGFVIASDERRVLLRAVGPGLASVAPDLDNLAENPRLILFNAQGEEIARNDDWSASPDLLQASSQAGAFALPIASLDAAVLATLAPGAYTARAELADGSGGVVIIEVYVLED